MEKAKQHVVPRQSGGWAVRRHGAARVSRVFDTRDDAVTYARDLARRLGSELYIHRADGSISQKYSYSSDPIPSR